MATDPVDVEKVLTRWLRERCGARTCTELPAAFEKSVPLVHVGAVGGPAARFTSAPRVDIDVYAATYEAARTLALTITRELALLRGPAEPGAIVSEVRVDSGPAARPYGNPAVRRCGASVTVRLHPASYGA